MAFWEIGIYSEPSKGFETLGGSSPFWESFGANAPRKTGRF